MKVKLKARYACPQGNYDVGAVVEFKDNVAKSLISGGYASAVNVVETANVETPEKAVADNSSRPEWSLKAVGGGFFNVVNQDGENLNDKPLKKAEAKALIDG